MRFYLFLIMILIANGYSLAANSSQEQKTAIYSAMSMGTGWSVTRRHIVTNYHVIKGMQNLRLVTSDRRELPLVVMSIDAVNDLAILALKDKNVQFQPLPLSQSTPQFGTQVFTIGYPHPSLMGISPKLTSGVVNAKSGLADDPRMLQVSVPVQSGNSGGPLVNMRGEVVGVITSKLSAQKVYEKTGDTPQNVNFAVKVNLLNSLLSKLNIEDQVTKQGAKKKQELATLAGNIVNSVNIVAGDGIKEKKALKEKISRHEIPSAPDKGDEPTIVVMSYAEPGTYDYDEWIEGSATVSRYSESTVKLLQKQLKLHLGSNLKLIAQSGEDVNSIYSDLYDAEYSKTICNQNRAHNIVASHSEKEPGADFRFVTFRMIDCSNGKEYKKQYTIERNVKYDNFGYEVALHTSFKDFLLKLPPYISWAGL